MLLAAAFPEVSLAELLDATVGQRDFWLLDLRKATFGRRALGRSACPRCTSGVDFEFDVDAFRVHEDKAKAGRIEFEGYAIDFRALTIRDLLRQDFERDVEAAQCALIEAAVVRATFEERPTPALSLPDTVVQAIGEAVWDLDPQSEIPLSLECPECGSEWSASFDVTSFLYGEVASHAKLLIEEVKSLARTYGWSEADILAMSPARRRLYLEPSKN